MISLYLLVDVSGMKCDAESSEVPRGKASHNGKCPISYFQSLVKLPVTCKQSFVQLSTKEE